MSIFRLCRHKLVSTDIEIISVIINKLAIMILYRNKYRKLAVYLGLSNILL